MSDPIFNPRIANPFGLTNAGDISDHTFADIDGDGDLDAFVGNYNGNTLFYRNTGTASSAVFAAPVTNPFGLTDVGGNATSILVDIDDDEDLDAFIGNYNGSTLFYRNTGTASSPVFAAPVTNPFGLTNVSDHANPSVSDKASPTLADIDDDGDLDAFVGAAYGDTLFYRNVGTASSAVFTAPVTNPFGLTDVGKDASPTLVDIDDDGDLDAFVGTLYGDMLFYRNVGTASSAVFTAPVTNPFGLTDVGYGVNHTLVDIDGDGDLDAFSGNWNGHSWFYLNSNTLLSYTDTAFVDNFSTQTGILGNDFATGATLTYGIADGTDNGVTVSKSNAYGTLTVNKTTGVYSFAPISTVIQALGSDATDNTLTVTVFDNTAPSQIHSKAFAVYIYQSRGTETMGNDYLVGTAGNDIFNALAGDDVINGRGGEDSMTGDLGNDIYYVDNVGDTVIETSNLTIEIDTVRSTINYTLGANVERLVLIGTAVINGTSNALNNRLAGDANPAANDLTGGAGNDIYVLGVGDSAIETSSLASEIDTVYSQATYTLGANLENLVLIGKVAINATGNALNNILRSDNNTAMNVLTGGAGNDTYSVGVGDSVIETSSLATEIDTVYFSTTPSYLAIWHRVNYTLTANVEKLILTGNAAINGTGNALNNVLRGDGNAAANVLTGGAGNDTYAVGAGDTINETSSLATQIDSVHSAISYTLDANVEKLVLTGNAAINGIGNTLNNVLIGNVANNVLADGFGADTLSGGLGKDTINLVEATAATDTVRIAAGDSLVSSFDVVNDFKLGTNTVNRIGVDRLDLSSTQIAANTAGVNGVDVGGVHSHSINNGLISFDNVDTYTAPLTITAGALINVFNYLQANITGGNTVAFVAEGNTFVFQDDGMNDTLVELVGVTALSVNTTGLALDSVWVV